MKKKIFEGVATALYTPFYPRSKKIDFDAFSRLIERQISSGISALVALGTTGESATINEYERKEIISFVIKKVDGRIPIIVGCGTNDTETTIKNSLSAQRLGADALLLVTPYYNKCNADGLFRHYAKVSSRVSLPIIVYNVPSRTGLNVSPSVYRKLSKIDNVVAIKETECENARLKKVFDAAKDLSVYCGADESFCDFLRFGGAGSISVTSNVIPCKLRDIYLNYKKDYKIDDDVEFLIKALFADVNPIPLKYAVKLLFGEGYGLRLPLTPANSGVKTTIETALNKFKEIR